MPVPVTPVKRARLAPGSLALLGALLSSATPLSAHDHWIQPSSFAVQAGERVDAHFLVGHPSQPEEQLRNPLHLVRFDDIGPLGTRPIVGVDGKTPAGILRPRDEGLHLLVFQSDHAFVEIDPETYARYLSQEGLEDIQAARERLGETQLPGRDSYARFSKALVRVVPAGAAREAMPSGSPGSLAGFDRVVGLPFELVLETNPCTWKPGSELVYRLEFTGLPLANRQVKLMRLEQPYLTQLARTDDAGRARFSPELGGAWAAFAVHQRRASKKPGDLGELEGDWEGFWASYSCEIGSLIVAGEAPASPTDAH